MSKPLLVLKFGGSSLATPKLIRDVATRLSDLHGHGYNLIVVVSAMGKTTDQLLTLAHDVSEKPNRRELDMLLTTGERISMALMSMALHDRNCPSISFTGSQAGVLTDNSFTNARILELKPTRVAEALAENKIVVLAGFQGVDPISREITTLGRGGSDTTAVAMAAHFKAERCEILKDVDGVYSADPKIVENAILYKNLSIDVLYEFCFWGAKVLNHRSVDWARKHKVPLFVGRSENFLIGTEIHFEKNQAPAHLLGVNSYPNVFEVSTADDQISIGAKRLMSFQETLDLPSFQILSESISNGRYHALFAMDKIGNIALQSALVTDKSVHLEKGPVATVTKTFSNSKSITEIVAVEDMVSKIRSAHLEIQSRI
jgi:aspartate kinase